VSIWFTADTHFGHSNIIKFCNRPFSSAKEMDECIIKNWNDRIKSSDTVYILGDFAMKLSIYIIRKILSSLKGQKYFILGDHDKQIWKCNDLLEEITPMKKINIDNTTITLCHYCLRVWPKSHYNAYMLYGHSHGRLKPIGKSYDVGVDNNDFSPVSYDEIKTIMDNSPNNFNYIGDRK